jgi:hypothetical protein
MSEDLGKPGAATAVSGAEHGTHAPIAAAQAAQALADQAEADRAAFDEDLALFAGQAVKPAVRRGPGRPAGSQNRATSRVREYLMARGYRDPMEHLAAIVAMDLRDLVALGLEVKDALALQLKAADALMPYWHQAQPKAVEVKVEGARPLFMFGTMSAPKAEADQGLKDVTPRASQIEGRAEPAQPVDDADIFGVRDDD